MEFATVNQAYKSFMGLANDKTSLKEWLGIEEKHYKGVKPKETFLEWLGAKYDFIVSKMKSDESKAETEIEQISEGITENDKPENLKNADGESSVTVFGMKPLHFGLTIAGVVVLATVVGVAIRKAKA